MCCTKRILRLSGKKCVNIHVKEAFGLVYNCHIVMISVKCNKQLHIVTKYTHPTLPIITLIKYEI